MADANDGEAAAMNGWSEELRGGQDLEGSGERGTSTWVIRK